MVYFLFFAYPVYFLISTIFFSKSVFISRGEVIKISFIKSVFIFEKVVSALFSTFIIYLFYVSKSYSGWLLLISIPFTIIVLSPFYNFFKKINSLEILLINTKTNNIVIGNKTYDVNDISYISIVKHIARDYTRYAISIVMNTNIEICLFICNDSKDVFAVVNELEKSFGLPIKCFKDRGLLGIVKVSKDLI